MAGRVFLCLALVCAAALSMGSRFATAQSNFANFVANLDRPWEAVLTEMVGYAAHFGVTGGAGGPLLTVTNLNDTGAGSLRQAISDASNGGAWIRFYAGLAGTINLASTIDLVRDITIDGRGADITIQGPGGTDSTFAAARGDQNWILMYLKLDGPVGTNNDILNVRNAVTDDPFATDVAERFWIYHVSFIDAEDELISLIRTEGKYTVQSSYFRNNSGGGIVHYAIPAGQYYTGGAMNLIFINDHDNGTGSFSRFSNVRVIEGTGNQFPTITNPGNQTTDLNDDANLAVIASDPEASTLSFSATSLPPGLTINNNSGVITGPATTLGTFNVTISVDDANGGSDTASFSWSVCDPSGACDKVDFDSSVTISYTNQDVDGIASVANGGATLVLSNNTWRQTVQTFNVTPASVLEFDFEVPVQGEIHGIGFDDLNGITPNRTFKLYGTQGVSWDITDFENYSGGLVHYAIPVGQYYTGSAMHLIMINDHDKGSGSSSRFSNVQVNGIANNHSPTITNPRNQLTDLNASVSLAVVATDPEGDALTFSATGLPPGLILSSATGAISGTPAALGDFNVTLTAADNNGGRDTASFNWSICDPNGACRTLDFNTNLTISYTNQDVDGSVSVADDGATLVVSGNSWRRTAQTFNITPATVLEFDFQSPVQGEIHGIGFDDLNGITPNRTFKLYGTQGVSWDISDFENYLAQISGFCVLISHGSQGNHGWDVIVHQGTWTRNHWDQCRDRVPFITVPSFVHVYNNYYFDWATTALLVTSRFNALLPAQLLFENNIASALRHNQLVKPTESIAIDGDARLNGNSFINGAFGAERNPNNVTAPPYTYLTDLATISLGNAIRAEAGWQNVQFPE